MNPNNQAYFNAIPEALRKIKNTSPPNEYYKDAIRYLKDQKLLINDNLRSFNFPNEEEEIHFFKVLKPILTSKIIYYKKRLEIQLNLPASQKARYKYYGQLLRKNNQKLEELKSISRYIRNQSTHRDQEYFLRKNNNCDLNDQYQFVFIDERTTTKMELAIATLLAKEQIISYLEYKMDEFEKAYNPNYEKISNLKWTGTQIDFTEFIYGMHNQKVINNGNVELKDVAIVFCRALNIKYDNRFYRYYLDIKRRKTPIKTKFFQSISDNFNDKILNEENDEEY